MLATLAAGAGAATFLWFGNYIGAGIGTLITLVSAWLVYEKLSAGTPEDHEREVVCILTRLGGRATEAEFEAALQAAADPFGNYGGEVLGDLYDAIERLQAVGRIRINDGSVVLMSAANR